MKNFPVDKDTKDLILKTSALLGLKPSAIRDVYEYTFITWLLQLSEQEGRRKKITVPYVGSIELEFDGEEIGEKVEKIMPICKSRSIINDENKKYLFRSYNNSQEDIIRVLKGKIKKVLNA